MQHPIYRQDKKIFIKENKNLKLTPAQDNVDFDDLIKKNCWNYERDDIIIVALILKIFIYSPG